MRHVHKDALMEGYGDGKDAIKRVGRKEAGKRAHDAIRNAPAEQHRIYWYGYLCAAITGRGRGPQGEDNNQAKLTEDNVREIRRRKGEKQIALAHEFGVDKNTIRRVVRRETWKHVV